VISRRACLGGAALARLAKAHGPDLSPLPNYCTHEHWGSIPSIGPMPGGFRADFEQGARPSRDTGLLDLLLEPYARGFYARAGDEIEASLAAGPDPWRAFQKILPAIGRQRFSGTFQTTRRGILLLYGADISRLNEKSFAALDGAIARNYAGMFAWHRKAMERSRLSGLIRPVHPEFYVRQAEAKAAQEEAAFTRTVMRIDPLVSLWDATSPRRAQLAEIAGIEPGDAATYRRFLDRLFEIAAKGGAVGIKQLQAYRRPLEFPFHPDGAVTWTGALSDDQQRVFENWMVHECSKRAHDFGWAHQVHVGTNNIEQSSPMGLTRLAQRYPSMKLVMIHCWPFLKEAGWIAKFHANAYLDTCWLPVLNPEFLREAISTWWNYVPAHKIMCGQDATSVEMAAGSSLFHREILADILAQRSRGLGMKDAGLMAAARAMLHDNAVALYGPPA
jgi:predicted TIM-barrel fold metal-dependent hydrolase